jgi:hypothetical protein
MKDTTTPTTSWQDGMGAWDLNVLGFFLLLIFGIFSDAFRRSRLEGGHCWWQVFCLVPAGWEGFGSTEKFCLREMGE